MLFKKHKKREPQPYKLNLNKDKIDERDLKLRSFVPIVQLPESVDLRTQFPTVFSQNDQGSCTANGGVAVLEYLFNNYRNEKTILSRQFLYNKERMNDNTPLTEDSGSSVRQICKTLKKDGCCEEALFTYGWHNFSVEPNQECCDNAKKYKIASYYRCETIYELKAALASEKPVLIGCHIYEDFYKTGKSGRVPKINTSTPNLGGHLMVLVGYKKRPFSSKVDFIIRNSWGESTKNEDSWGYAFNNPSDSGWGDNGYGYIDENNLLNILMDAWVISSV